MVNDSNFGGPTPRLTEAALKEKQAREAREAAALRANLRRRRAQAQARHAEDEAEAEAEAEGQLPNREGSGRGSS
jgi:hypothetical protein